jgi:hypothetical protein
MSAGVRDFKNIVATGISAAGAETHGDPTDADPSVRTYAPA